MPAISFEMIATLRIPMITVLYVDDESAHLGIGKQYLENTGKFTVDTAASARKAIALEKFPQYDAIVSDYLMPGMDGLEFLRFIRGTGNAVPFILLTGRGREEVVIQALNEGADFYLRKSGDPDALFTELAHTIQTAVDQHHDKNVIGIPERALQESEERFRELFNNMKSGAAIYEAVDNGMDFVFRDFNHAAEVIDKLAKETVIGRRVSEVFPGIRDFGLMDVFSRVWRTGQSEHHPVSLYHDQRVVGWRDNFVYRLPSGEIVAMYDDITGRKQEEEELRFKNIILSTQQETSPEAILIVDENARIVSYNQKLVQLWGIPEKNIASGDGETILQYTAGQLADPEAYLARVRYLYNHREEKSSDELRLKDGRILERFSSPMLGDEGKYYGRVWYFRNITDGRQAEEALKKSEEKYRTLADASKDFVYIIDRDDNVAYANRFCLAMLKKTSEEVIGRPRRDLFDGDVAERQYQTLRQVFLSGRPSRIESTVPMPGGVTWQDTYLVPLKTDDGAVSAVMGVSRDITERKQAEEHLRESEEKFRTYIENSPEGIFVIDHAGTYIDANRAACMLTGYSPNELLSLTISSLAPEECRDGLNERLRELRETGRLSRELRLQKKGGAIISVMLNAVRLPDGTAVAFCMDTTERRNAEDAVRENLERYRLILKNANEGILVNELTPRGPGKFIEANESACRISGMTREELQGVNLIDLDTPLMQQRAPEIMQELLQNRHVRFQTPYITKDNHEKIIEISSSLFELSGRTTMLSVVRDITEEKRAEQALQQANKKLNLMTSITRHDIKNQLLSLNAYLALSQETLGDAQKTREYIRTEEAITRTIERQILFTREYENLGAKAPVWQNVQECIRRAAAELDLTGIALTMNDLKTVEIFADSLLQKVFFNLIDNSLRHGGTAMTRIRFSCRETESGLMISCEDDGQGIPKEEKEMIFERGYGKNTGFGLFFILEILAITGITIQENGEPAKGARFVITVPRGEWRIPGKTG